YFRSVLDRYLRPIYLEGLRVLGAAGPWAPDQLPHLAIGLYHLIFGYFADTALLEMVLGENPRSPAAVTRQRRFLKAAVAQLLGVPPGRAPAPPRLSPGSRPMPIDHVTPGDPDPSRGGVPPDAFARLRAEAPVYFHPEADGPGFWVLSRYADVTAASLDSKTFSSWKGGTMIRDLQGEDLDQTRLMMLNMDAPRHTKYRRLVSLGFTPRMVTRLTPHVRAMASRIIDNVAARGECDFVTEIAAELPLQAIAEMIGVPLEDRHLVFEWSNRLVGFDDP